MINLKAKDEAATNAAFLIALLIILGSLAFSFLVPKPDAKSVIATRKEQQKKIFDEVDDSRKAFTASQARVVTETWTGSAAKIGPGALTAMNALATQHKVKLSGFRPERVSQAAGLELDPYTVTAEGSYPDVVNFTKAIEDPNTKLCVDSVQIASADANGDSVAANIGITAYRVVGGGANG